MLGKSFSVFAAYSCLISWKGDKIQQLMTSTPDLQLFEIIKKSWGGPVEEQEASFIILPQQKGRG